MYVERFNKNLGGEKLICHLHFLFLSLSLSLSLSPLSLSLSLPFLLEEVTKGMEY